jgi:peptidyl-dipeptidase Dcp
MNDNPLLIQSQAPFGAPMFDKILPEHYLPAFKAALIQAKDEVDAIASNPEQPDFHNAVEALEYSGRHLADIEGIFFNILEADSSAELEKIAEEVSPMLTEFEMYVSHNEALFAKCKSIYSEKDSLDLSPDQKKLLENTYKDFVRNGANLSKEDQAIFGNYLEKLSLLELKFGQNVLESTKAFSLNLIKKEELEGLPEFVIEMGRQEAKDSGKEGCIFSLDRSSYDAFMKFSPRRDLREKLFMAYNTRSVGGKNDNTDVIKQIVELRMKVAAMLGYDTYADYVLEERMAKNRKVVERFLDELMEPSLPAAKKEVAEILEYARHNGFKENELQPWDFSFWSEKYRQEKYSINEEALKPYFPLEKSIDAIFSLATKLYGLHFDERHDIPVYHPDVKVFDVLDADGKHLALFYADFFPRKSKRGGAWMTEFRGQYSQNGVDFRPFISIVTNVSKPTGDKPALLSFYEFTTILHEFGHSLHGMLSKGRYPSLSGTNVATDFVELPSQLMENWAFEPSYLNTFARHYKTGETIPSELMDRIVASRNYLAGYMQVRQLKFGFIDMAWHTLKEMPKEGTAAFEHEVLDRYEVLPVINETAFCPSFTHIFSGGYSAGYYSYKWAEVLEADAFGFFKEKGLFGGEAADKFRTEILEKGSSEDESLLYRNFRGCDPKPEALLRKLGIMR